METPNIDFNYWLSKWYETTGNANVLNVAYSDFRGTLNELESEILRVINYYNLTDQDILRVIDLVNQWGGKMSRGFYIPRPQIQNNGQILIVIPRQLIEEEENMDRYKVGINLARQNNLDSVNYFRQFGIGPSYIGKHAYFWSNCNLPIVDAKIAGCFGYNSSQILLNTYTYANVVQHMNVIKEKNHLDNVVKVEKSLFSFHKNYFDNGNTKFKDNIQDFTDCTYAIHIANLLEIQIPEHVLNQCLKS